MDIGKIIYILRKEENLTQEKLANQIGIAQTNISDWENNVSRPEYENLVKLSKIFAVSTDYLLGLEDESGSKICTNNINIQNLTQTKPEILELYDSLNSMQQQSVLGYIKGLKSVEQRKYNI